MLAQQRLRGLQDGLFLGSFRDFLQQPGRLVGLGLLDGAGQVEGEAGLAIERLTWTARLGLALGPGL